MPSVARKIADCQDWLVQISKNEVEAVLEDVLNFVAKKENETFAFKCILVSSKLVYSNKCSTPKAIFTVVDACCRAIAPNYACDQLKLLSALYHVTSYLLKQNLLQEAILISENVLGLRKTKPKEWSTDEENIITALLFIFSKSFTSFNFSQDLNALRSLKNKSSALNLWNHLVALVLCSNKKPLSDSLCNLIQITVQCKSQERKKISDFILTCLQSLLACVENIAGTRKFKLDESLLIRILRTYRPVVLTYIASEKVSEIKKEVISVLAQMKEVFACSEELITCIQFCEKVLQFAYSSMLDLSLDPKLLNESLTAMNTWKKGELSYSLAYFMSNILIKLRIIWSKRQPKLSSEVISSMIQLALKSGKFLDGYRTEVCSGCSLNCDETTCLQLNCFPLHLLVLYTGQNPEKNETITKFYAKIYKDLEKLVAENINFIHKMHDAGCPRCSDLFSYLLPFLSNSIYGYPNTSQYKSAFNLTFLMLQKFAKLSTQFLEQYFSEKYLVKLINWVCYCCRTLGDFESPLKVIAAFVVLLPSKRRVLFKLWTDFKNDASKDETKGTKIKDTVAHVLESNSSEFKKEWNLPELSSEDLTTLLLEEVKAYWKHDLRFCEPCFAVFEASQKLKISIENEATLLCFVLRFLAQHTISEKHVASMLDRVKAIETQLCALKKKSNAKEKVKINILLGCLILARVCCLILKIRSHNEVELNSQKEVVEQPKDHERGTEINDLCTVTPVLSYIKIDQQQQLFELIDEGIKYLSTAVTTKALESLQIDTCLLFDSIVDAACICKLYGYATTEFTAWELGFRFSYSLKNNEISITAMSNILQLKTSINPKWVAHTDELVKSLEPSDSFLKHTYALAVIRNRFLKQDYDSVRKLLKEIDLEEIKKHRVLYAEYYFLLSKCFFDPDVSPDSCAMEAYICLAALVKEKSWANFTESCKLNCLIFEASANIGQNYLELMLPREVRHFVKSTLKLAQRLAVPLRLAEVLVQLTWVEVMCCNTSESLAKIQILEEILQLNFHVSNLVPIKTGSRRTKLIKVEPPEFLKHENCQCFICASPACQKVMIEAVRLQGAVANLQPDFRNYSMDFLKCAQKILEKVCCNKKEEWMQLTEIKLFIQYVDHLCIVGNWKEATKINQKISAFITSFPDMHPCNKILKQDAEEQSLSVNCSLKMAV